MSEGSYWPDMAFDVDKPEWKLAEELHLSLEDAEKVYAWHQAELTREVEHVKGEQLGRIVGLLIKPAKNLKALVRSLALAAGLDELNGVHSQDEVAKELGCTRQLISHYVTAWADLLDLEVFKFRKVSSARQTFSESAKRAWAERKKGCR
ncbi:MAG: hypothetical protein FGM22_08415 [Burkholderiaceae bacterium]|nr:hypothetical protein [Burkholderiaceae bacterium]